MNLGRLDVRMPFGRLRGEMDRLFDNILENVPAFALPGTRSFPAVNVWEDNEQLYAEAEIPGLKLDDLDVSVLGDELTIKGCRCGAEEEGVTFHRRERGTGDFCRVLRLPVEIDAEKVEATLRDGVLTIKLPKSAASLPRRIEVKA